MLGRPEDHFGQLVERFVRATLPIDVVHAGDIVGPQEKLLAFDIVLKGRDGQEDCVKFPVVR